MKLVGQILFALFTLTSAVSFAAGNDRRTIGRRPAAAGPRSDAMTKSLISFEYNSWFEKLSIYDSEATLQQDSKAEYYGFGINYEQNTYLSTWGWGLGGGIASGTAVGGDAGGSLQYFQARVPWT
ncbi:MAG: hypothetical protein EOP06_16810, partial [Proteobacteria bacterium]